MRFITTILVLAVLLLNYQIAEGAENEYGSVKAWFNGENATVNGVQLKVGEPVQIKVEVTSKINGNAYIKLKEPGVTKAYKISDGPSAEDVYINNYDITEGWSKTYTWFIEPNGNWKNGNAPINILVSFSKKGNQKPIQFTIANPYILDEQYSGAVSTPKPTSSSTETAPSTPAKAAPFPSALFAIVMLLLAACRVRRR
jgi:sarcinarray family protein